MKILAHISFVLFLVLCSFTVFSQDVIILKSGDEIQAKVEEIKPDVVTYRKYENLQGPLYTIEKSKIFMIKYANGSKDLFPEYRATLETPSAPQTPNPQQTAPMQNPQANANPSPPSQLVYISGGNIRMNNSTLSTSKVKDVMRPYPEAFSLYSSGRSLKVTGDVFEGVGYGFAIAMFIALLNDEDEAAQITGGFAVATLGTSLILEGIGKKNIRKSVKAYNNSIAPTSHLYIIPGSVGYCLSF